MSYETVVQDNQSMLRTIISILKKLLDRVKVLETVNPSHDQLLVEISDLKARVDALSKPKEEEPSES